MKYAFLDLYIKEVFTITHKLTNQFTVGIVWLTCFLLNSCKCMQHLFMITTQQGCL